MKSKSLKGKVFDWMDAHTDDSKHDVVSQFGDEVDTAVKNYYNKYKQLEDVRYVYWLVVKFGNHIKNTLTGTEQKKLKDIKLKLKNESNKHTNLRFLYKFFMHTYLQHKRPTGDYKNKFIKIEKLLNIE